MTTASAFSQGTVQAIHAIVNFALGCGVKQFVTVTTVGVEKMLIRLGLDASRFGPALQVGVERAVALRIELNDRTTAALERAIEVYIYRAQCLGDAADF